MALAAGVHQAPFSAWTVLSTFGTLALAFAAVGGHAWVRRRRDAGLRREVRARPFITFQARVDAKQDFVGMDLPVRGKLDLIVRGDVFEISHPIAPARFIFGQEWYFIARETTVEVYRTLGRDWILVERRSPPAMIVGTLGRSTRVSIRRRNMNPAIWDALIRAGARPVGAPARGQGSPHATPGRGAMPPGFR
jgi:hypothetical protein